MTQPSAPTPNCRLILGDSLDVLQTLDADSVDAVVTDPPYGLEFMGKEWDTFRMDERSARWASRSGAAGGFGETEDGSKLPNYGRRRTTSRCRNCLKRDAFRNPHVCDDTDSADWVIEYVDDVPVEMRAFQNWCHTWAVEVYRVLKPGGHLLAFGGTRTYHRMAVAVEDAGFDVRDSLHWIYGSGFPKSLDVAKQIDKTVGAEREVVGDKPWKSNNGRNKVYGKFNAESEVLPVTAPATDEAKQWDGWGTALKPAHEPIILARKPLAANTVTANVLEFGTGALNVGATAIGTTGGTKSESRGGRQGVTYAAGALAGDFGEPVPGLGRWPSNVLLAHLPDCQGETADHTDVLCAPGCPVAELNEISGITTSPAVVGRGRNLEGATPIGPQRDEIQYYAGPNDSGGAARFFYIAKPKTRERIGGTVRNLHPTVKPVALMRYLVRLVTPPNGVVLDPFLGSGSTGCAAMAEGARFVGIERDEDSFQTSLERIGDYAFANGRERPTVG